MEKVSFVRPVGENLAEAAAKQGRKQEQNLQETFEMSKQISAIRGRDLLWCVEFLENTDSRTWCLGLRYSLPLWILYLRELEQVTG
ncbi:uncharacterized protein M421DRAFT_415792 [Didymella exigua CBS 183.55]|uniref:Uncharacterized protein n=1 Tax=Didymella exigua CBS 183.55 TaxID=1150837 RepID=A0A6A5S7F9_9PLEO|nr:uncharacterized protein M421DRAFT_415792 [Didymella exigua CBS 183.55]KAF1933447.1 hypothetical protein M421DRAFT_415792 [Didymella exigua CBS 183.55]